MIYLAAKSLQLCPTLCDPIDGSPAGSLVPGILQARTLEWFAISFSDAWKWKVKSEKEVAQLCPTLSDPMDCSLPGASVHGIFQARVLGWGAIAFSERILIADTHCCYTPWAIDDSGFKIWRGLSTNYKFTCEFRLVEFRSFHWLRKSWFQILLFAPPQQEKKNTVLCNIITLPDIHEFSL